MPLNQKPEYILDTLINEKEKYKKENEILTKKINELKSENKTIIHQLNKSIQEIDILKRLHNEQMEEILLNDSLSQESERFFNILTNIINNKHMINILPENITYGIIKVDWSKIKKKNNKREPYIFHIAHRDSRVINLFKHYEFEGSEIINKECKENSILKKTILEIIEDSNASKIISFKKKLSKNIYGQPADLNIIVIRDKYKKVSGMFFTISPSQKDEEIKYVINKNKTLKENVNNIISQAKTFHIHSSKLFNTVIESLQVTTEEILWYNQTINQLSEQIRSSAERTKVLSLNAAIEAARTDTQRKGFSIVSNEIRILTENNQKHITQLVKMLNKAFQGISSLQLFKQNIEEYTEQYKLFEKLQTESYSNLDIELSNLLSCYNDINIQDF